MPPRIPSQADIRIVFFGLTLGAFLSALNQTIIATALPTIGRDFHDFENLSWIVTAYLLTSTAVAPLYGKLSDIHGRRTVMLAGIGIFVVGSAACAMAPNMTMLVVGRALQGLGGGGILPLTQAIIADLVPPRERGRYQAYMGTVWVSAGVGGPVLGGVLSEHLHWSAIFWLNVPLGLVAGVISSMTLRRLPRHDRRHKLDLIGAVLMMAACTPLLLALTWGGTRFPWLSLPVALLIASSGLLTLMFAWRLTHAKEPFLPLTVLANPVMRWGTAATALAMGTSIGLTIFLPLYFEVVHKMTASSAGLALIPLAAMTTPGSVLSGRAMLHLDRYKWVPMVGIGIGVVALGCLAWQPAMPLVWVLVISAVLSISIGTVYPVATVSIQNAVPHRQVGVAMGAMNFFRALASAFVVAAMGAILLAGFGAAPERGAGVSSLAAVVSALGVDASRVFGFIFLSAALCLAGALVALAVMEERPLRGRVDPPPVTPPPDGTPAE